MFWCEVDRNNGFIKKAWLDGSHIKIIKSGPSVHPLAMCIDIQYQSYLLV